MPGLDLFQNIGGSPSRAAAGGGGGDGGCQLLSIVSIHEADTERTGKRLNTKRLDK
jgi:hypothetical protein